MRELYLTATGFLLFCWLVLTLAVSNLSPLFGGEPAGGGESAEKAPANPPAPAAGHSSGERFREGHRVTELAGRFESGGGERYSFFPEGGKERYTVLENIALERVAQKLDESRDAQWVVSGVFTEFKGANYLSITKAAIKTKADSANPK